MTLDPSIDLGVEVLDEGAILSESVVTTWLAPLLPDGQVASGRVAGGPLPFIEVSYINGTELDEEGHVEDVVSVHCLYAKGTRNENKVAAGKFADIVHRRMMLLARTLEDVVVNGTAVDLEYVAVFSRMEFVDYGDDKIWRKVGRYRIGQSYAKLS